MDLIDAVKEGGNPLHHGDVGSLFLGYQARWVADESPVKIAEKSRRIGLTWAEAGDSALLAARQDGMDVWYIGYNKDMALEFIRDCGDWAKVYQLVAGEIEETEEVFVDGDDQKAILAFVIRFASGFRITALSSRPSNLRGKQGRVIVDEAAFVPDLAELIKAAMALLIWGGQVHIISTHDGEENDFNELVQEILAGKKPYSHHRITLDDALEAGLFKRICKIRGQVWTAEAEAEWRVGLLKLYGAGADEELFCIPRRGGGAWLSRVLVEARMYDAPVVRYRAPEGMSLWPEHLMHGEILRFCEEHLMPLLKQLDSELCSVFGEDFGRTGDLSVFMPAQIQRNLVRKVPFILELARVPFKAQEQILYYVLDRLPRFSHGMFDARGNGEYLAEVAQNKYGEERITCVKLTETWYRENTAQVKAAFEDGTILLPRDADTLEDMCSFKLIRGVPRIPDERTDGKDGQKRHGDTGVAALMMHAASRQELYQPAAYYPVSVGALRRDRERGGYDDEDFRDIQVTHGFRATPGAF